MKYKSRSFSEIQQAAVDRVNRFFKILNTSSLLVNIETNHEEGYHPDLPETTREHKRIAKLCAQQAIVDEKELCDDKDLISDLDKEFEVINQL